MIDRLSGRVILAAALIAAAGPAMADGHVVARGVFPGYSTMVRKE